MTKTAKFWIYIPIAGILLALSAIPGSALTLSLAFGNSALTGYPSPFGSVDVTLLTPTTATIDFTSNLGPIGGYQYGFGDGGTADYNLADAANVMSSISSFTSAPWATAGAGPFSNGGSGVVDGFGTFNQTWNDFDGFTHNVSDITFSLTRTSGTWASENDILTPNANGDRVAVHVFAVNQNDWSQAVATGYATEGQVLQTPEPTPLLSLGTVLLGFGAMGIRRKRRV